MKKLCTILFCLILAAVLLPLAAAPVRAESEGDWQYWVQDSTVVIEKYTGAGGDVTIPSTLGGKPVTGIGSQAFYDCSSLTSVTIPNSVTTIGGWAFYNCSSLQRVNISDLAAWCGIQFGGLYSNPLYYAHNLYLNGQAVTQLTIPNGVTAIRSYAFCGCTGLTSVTIPNSVTSIGGAAFRDCSSLQRVDISDLAA